MSAIPTRRRTFGLLALVAIGYLYVFPYQPRINNPNENARFYMTAAIAEEGTYVLDGMRARWGWVNDCAIYEGRAYSVKAPATSFLGVPGYAAYYWGGKWLGASFDRTTALWICRVTGSILPWLAFLFVFHRGLGRHTSSALLRDAVFVSIALGSCLYGYGLLFVSHTLSAASAFGAFMLLYDGRHAGRMRAPRAFWAGLLTAGVTLLEYPGVLVSLALSAYALLAVRPYRRLVPFALGGMIPTLAMMHFQWKCFGSPFSPGHLYVETTEFRELHEEGFFGSVGLQGDALYGLLFHPGAGLFPLTPILLFGVVGLAFLIADRRQRLDGAIATAVVLSTVLAIATMVNWRGGWTIGPRYLAVVYPFLAWGALVGLERLGRTRPRLAGALALGATGVGLVSSGIPSAYYPHYPAELDRPLTQIVRVLIAHDFAPFNAANLFGVYGTASMLPLALLGLVVLVWIVGGAVRRDRAFVAIGGVLVAFVVSALLSIDPRPSAPDVRRARALITRTWDPSGHDRAAVLERELQNEGDADGYRRLAALYEAEGREREAHAARAKADALEREE